MQTETLIYIILAGIGAILLALFQYYNKKKSMSKLNMLFSFLRFLSIFSILLLLINPKFEQLSFFVEKPNLVVAIDNSSSIKHLNQDTQAISLVEKLSNNDKLNDKFNIDLYTFGESLKASDSTTFFENQTNINNAFKQLSQIYRQTTAPTVIISDGNQTYGNDYQFATSTYKQNIFPIILGDTVTYTDLKIQQLNVNKYAYLKNRFPIEAILVYNGNNAISSRFIVTKGNATVYSESIRFSKENNSKIVNFTLPANGVGVSSYRATIVPIDHEKNKINNSKNFAVEVIDQKTKIAIVSDFPHPDLGTFKKSIESNEQRSVTFLNSKEILNQINDFQLIIINQPNYKFKELFDILKKDNKNYFTIIGTKSDLNFINNNKLGFTYEITNQTESYQAELNTNYTPFIVDDINFELFPPLNSNYGLVSFTIPFESILNKSINGISTNEPLLVTYETNGRREGVLFGENIWQWRAQSYINNKSFNQFDDFIGKLVQYLASNKRKDRLNIDYESFYNGSSNIIIKAEFFDKNYIFDARETLNISVTDETSKETKTFPLILKNNNFQVDLSSLPPSEYNFTVSATNDKVSKSGSFQVLEYNVEQQFLNANVTKLQQLATNSEGKSYFIDNTESLINDLLNDNRFVSIQKSHKNIIPLIDWKYLLIILALSLGLEWFIRKYNGLI
ncbi:VWA domain-containing protein [Flavivirga rizhaonensis]|uniref:VWA domain-containing protein n=1 Tax=Flavivirga rizhaonensis TaxID=2559571 RepID=A0A4S1E242_9FLAO|nr:VWA domain-containing protein [Flavivirga rizhaonensis]TGV03982.1 VWA domain-containing protein [Flavivirga rizhaonensis]